MKSPDVELLQGLRNERRILHFLIVVALALVIPNGMELIGGNLSEAIDVVGWLTVALGSGASAHYKSKQIEAQEEKVHG